MKCYLPLLALIIWLFGLPMHSTASQPIRYEITATQKPAESNEVDAIEYVSDSTNISYSSSVTNMVSITLDEVPLDDVVGMFAQICDFNIIVSTTNLYDKTVTVNLRNVDARVALASILDTHGLVLDEESEGIYTIREHSRVTPMILLLYDVGFHWDYSCDFGLSTNQTNQISINVQDAEWPEIIKKIASNAKVNMAYDQYERGHSSLTMNMDDVHWVDALRLVADTCNLTVEPRNRCFVIKSNYRHYEVEYLEHEPSIIENLSESMFASESMWIAFLMCILIVMIIIFMLGTVIGKGRALRNQDR